MASIQQELPTIRLDDQGRLPYVGRLGVYESGEANILFVHAQLKKIQPNADYDHLTLVGSFQRRRHAMYFAKQHPELVRRVVTLDNLRVPFVTDDNRLKILSFRSHDQNFKTDPGVLPTPQEAKADDIDIIQTQFQHTWLSDRGPYSARERIQAALDSFLGDGKKVQQIAARPERQPAGGQRRTPLP